MNHRNSMVACRARPTTRRLSPTLLAFLALAILPGCLFRSRTVERRMSSAVLREATLAQLVETINHEAARIQTLNATVDIAPSVGGSKRGKITDFQDMRGYILLRQPATLRMIGLFPILRNTAFDMVSDGEGFRLSIPTKSRFYVGRNDAPPASKKPIENLRPRHILDALLLRPIDAEQEIAVLEGSTETVRDPKTKKDVEQPNYVVTVIRRNGLDWKLSRKITFSRADLLPYRQVIHDADGSVATEADYEHITEYHGGRFPAVIHLWRPKEEYAIVLSMVKLSLNQPLQDEQFVLNQPQGYELRRLGEPVEPQATKTASPSR
jgi:hypothetical protein